jgi:hypothetical protein
MAARDSLERGVLPIPDCKPVGLTTYDAKDPDLKFPPLVSKQRSSKLLEPMALGARAYGTVQFEPR